MKALKDLISECKEVVKLGDSKKAEILVTQINNLYGSKIEELLKGTKLQIANTNKVWNLNDGMNLIVEYDYLGDLSLLTKKLEIYYGEITGNKVTEMAQIDKSINIHNSKVSKSIVGSNVVSNAPEKNGWKIFFEILGGIAAIATIVGVLLSL